MEKSSRPARSPATVSVKIPSSTTTTCAATGAAKPIQGTAQARERRSAGGRIPEMYPWCRSRSRSGREAGYNPACPPSAVPSSV